MAGSLHQYSWECNVRKVLSIAVSDHINLAFTVNVEELPEKMGKNHVTNNTTSVKLDWSAFMNMTSWPVIIRQINI